MIQICNKFLKILSRRQIVRLGIIAVLMIIGAVLETLGVGLIMPLVSAITTPDFIESNKFARMICELLDLHSPKTFVLAVISALILIYIFKNIYLFIEYYIQWRFICNNRFLTQLQLMKHYLHLPYQFYLNAESGEILRVINDDVNRTFTLLSTVLSFFTEAVICVALVITIVITDPLMAVLIAVVLGSVLLIVNRMLKPILNKAGIRLQKNVAQSNKWLMQSITGIKEVKVARCEEFFLNQFSIYGKKAVDSEKINNVLGNIPRLSIEAFGISSMLLVIAGLMYFGREINSMLPQLTAFAMAAVRLLPSVNRMATALSSMAYYEPALDKMIEHLSEINKGDDEAKSSNALNCNSEKKIRLLDKVELQDITYSYPGADQSVLKHADMEIEAGKSVGIVGASGSGKTTAIDVLLGLLEPQFGCVKVNGQDIQADYDGWLASVGYIPQMIYMLDDTIRANVAFGIPHKEINDTQVWNALDEAQLKEFVQSLPDGLDTMIGERGIRLSGGQRQRIGISRALYSDPKLLIFDEATSALDNETEAAIMESINALHGKKTMIIIAHRLTTIKECDMVYRVADGKIQKERMHNHG